MLRIATTSPYFWSMGVGEAAARSSHAWIGQCCMSQVYLIELMMLIVYTKTTTVVYSCSTWYYALLVLQTSIFMRPPICNVSNIIMLKFEGPIDRYLYFATEAAP